jgi:hypothetical protein
MFYLVGKLIVMTGSKGLADLWFGDWVLFEEQEDGSLLPIDSGRDNEGFQSPMDAAEVGGALGVDAARRAQGDMSLPFGPYTVKVRGQRVTLG